MRLAAGFRESLETPAHTHTYRTHRNHTHKLLRVGKEEGVTLLNEKVSRPVLRLGVALLVLWGVGDVVVLICAPPHLASGRNYTKGAQGPTFWTFFPPFLIYFRTNLGRSGLKSALEQLMEL